MDEQQIQTNLEVYTQKSVLSDDEKIKEITIDKRQTQKDAGIDTVWCTVQTKDERCASENSFVLTNGELLINYNISFDNGFVDNHIFNYQIED